jgi:hypothetical protein
MFIFRLKLAIWQKWNQLSSIGKQYYIDNDENYNRSIARPEGKSMLGKPVVDEGASFIASMMGGGDD